MKTRSAVGALVSFFLATAASFGANPHLGTWRLNDAKSTFPEGMGRNTMVTYTAEKGDKIKVTVEGTDKDGKPTQSTWVGRFDGKAYPAKGNLQYDSVTYKMVNDRTNDITAMKSGKMIWTGRIEVAKDGNSRTVTINGTDEKGKKFKAKAFYDKA
jgi:hypothetical protein